MPAVAPVPVPGERGFPLAPCPHCGREVAVVAFPASRRRAAVAGAGMAASDGDSVCFHHQGKRAEVACEMCGRFLCDLCHVDLDGRAVCAACLTQMHTHSHKTRLTGNATSAHVPRRIRYDKIALACVILSPFVCWGAFINAGVALYLCFRHWKTPISVIPRNRWRFVVAGIGAAVILALYGLLAVGMLSSLFTARQMVIRNNAPAAVREVSDDDE